MAGTIGYTSLWNLVNRADRNRNGRLEAGDGYVLGEAGARNQHPAVVDTFHAIWRGEAALDGLRLSQADADASAAEIATNQGFVDESQVSVSRAAKAAIDGVGGGAFDGRISRQELSVALQWGAIAVGRDGLALSQEARDYFARRSQQPAQPTPNPQPTWPQAPQNPQPTWPQPAPTWPSPQTPQGQGDYVAPAQIFSNFYYSREQLLARWGGQKDATGFKNEERPLIQAAVNQLFTTRTGTYEERKAALTRVYQYSSMSWAEYDSLAKQLAQYAAPRAR